MKKTATFLFAAFSLIASAHAVEFSMIGQNAEVLIHKNLKHVDLTKPVSAITLSELAKKYGANSDKVEADEASVTEVAGLRTEFHKYSDGSQRALGWCYKVNGVLVDDLMDQVFLKSQSDTIVWYYGSISADKNGVWEKVCRPVYSWEVY